ncbi:MAG: hypothetical protein KF784_03990 [Fimbriimonadaceae bacterium]|nr:hypothetical protein [Fimbriimonadaceae bacterium]
MRPWQFRKPKNPGFGINRNFYLSVLASRATLPSILEVVNPKGDNAAIQGFGAPLAADATKEDLSKPLVRGAYAVASPDRKTVLRMLVVHRDEAGYDPEVLLRSSMADQLSPELTARIRGAWHLIQLTFESHDAMVYPALDFLQKLAKKLAELADGAIADPVSQRYLLPEELVSPRSHGEPFVAADHIAVRFFAAEDKLSAFTLGMQKFALPELEITDLNAGSKQLAEAFLLHLSREVLLGRTLNLGDRVGGKQTDFEVATGGLDRARWEGIPCLELIPARGKSSIETLTLACSELGIP